MAAEGLAWAGPEGWCGSESAGDGGGGSVFQGSGGPCQPPGVTGPWRAPGWWKMSLPRAGVRKERVSGSLPSQTRDSWGLSEPPVPGAGGCLPLCAGGRGGPSCCASFCCRCCFSSPWPGGSVTPAAAPPRGWGSIKRMAGDSGGPCTAWPLCCLLSVICVARRARATVGRARHPESP